MIGVHLAFRRDSDVALDSSHDGGALRENGAIPTFVLTWSSPQATMNAFTRPSGEVSSQLHCDQPAADKSKKETISQKNRVSASGAQADSFVTNYLLMFSVMKQNFAKLLFSIDIRSSAAHHQKIGDCHNSYRIKILSARVITVHNQVEVQLQHHGCLTNDV